MLLVVNFFTGLFSPNSGGIAVDHVFPILDIPIHSEDVRNQILKLSEIDRNFARFWPPTFFDGVLPKC